MRNDKVEPRTSSVPPELPDPRTMSRGDLIAEVEGGRIAYAHLLERKERVGADLEAARKNVDGYRRLYEAARAKEIRSHGR